MPRFARDLTENGKELLSMNEVLIYLINSYKPLINEQDLQFIQAMQSEVSNLINALQCNG
jgi:ribonuclease-3